MVQTKATVKLATAATPTNHHIMAKEEKRGIKEVATPLANMRKETRRIDLFLPQMSETIPATKVPTAKPEKKTILEMTGSPLEPQTKSHSEVIVSSQKLLLYSNFLQYVGQTFYDIKKHRFL